MRRRLLLLGLTSAFVFGCGNDGGRGVNRDRDRPRAADPAPHKPADKDKASRSEPGKK